MTQSETKQMRIPARTHALLQAEAKRTNRTITMTLRLLVEKYLGEEKEGNNV